MFKLRLPGKKTAKWNKEFWRSNSFPSSSSRFSFENGDPSSTFLDDTNIQIIISSDPSLSHAHTPVKNTSAVASVQDENMGVNVITPEDETKLYIKLLLLLLLYLCLEFLLCTKCINKINSASNYMFSNYKTEQFI